MCLKSFIHNNYFKSLSFAIILISFNLIGWLKYSIILRYITSYIELKDKLIIKRLYLQKWRMLQIYSYSYE